MTESALPPVLPVGWESTPRAGGLLIHESRRSDRRQSLGLGIVAVVLWVITGVVAAGGLGRVGFACFCALFAIAATYGAVVGWFTQSALLVNPGALLTGQVWVGNLSWVRPPVQVSAVLLAMAYDLDSGRQFIHLNLLLSTRVLREFFEMPGCRADDCRAIGGWLAAKAEIPLTDSTDTPQARRRRSRPFGIQ